MRLVKGFFIVAVFLFVFITLFSLLIPSHPRVSRTVVINSADKRKIMSQVADLTNWKNWHPFFASDSNCQKVVFGEIVKGQDASCEFLYSKKEVHLKITKVDSSSVTFLLQAKGENDITNQIFFYSIESSQQTRVDWIATTHLHWYPWEKFYAIFVDKLTGPGYEAALNGLKQFIETH